MSDLSAAIADMDRCTSAAAAILARFPTGYPAIINTPMPPDAMRDLWALQDEYIAAQQDVFRAHEVVQQLYWAFATAL